MLQDRLHLVAGNAGEPVDELVDGGSGLEVVQEGGDRDPGYLEQPCSDDLAGMRSMAGHVLQASPAVILCVLSSGCPLVVMAVPKAATIAPGRSWPGGRLRFQVSGIPACPAPP